ncbi:MAG: AraC family transcriptional regulator [Hyphomicrobiales bacterium]
MTETVRGHLLDLSRAYRERCPVWLVRATGAIGAARLSTALDYIATHFSDPGLTAAVVAHSQNVSSRYLNRLFEGAGIRFNHYLQEQRLSEAHRLLNDAGSAGMAISEIAFGCGFSDVSHFNRLFRQRFGDSPSGVRARPATG